MSPLSQISRIRQRITRLTRKRQAVERRLLGRSELLKGTMLEVQRTCGKPGCKCARGEKHACYQLSASVEGKRHTWNVPRRYLAKVKPLAENYRRFRRARADWVRVNEQMLKLIGELESARMVSDFRDEPRRQKS
ncbi:MAG: hypothetical protein KKD63_16675 [Proteobacteria bacterium]|nr:hypothetical protein [Pseudomonadota bacterium]